MEKGRAAQSHDALVESWHEGCAGSSRHKLRVYSDRGLSLTQLGTPNQARVRATEQT